MSPWYRITLVLVVSLAFGRPSAGLLQARGGGQSSEVQIYEKFRAWVTKQPAEVQGPEALNRYRAVLAAEGLSSAEIERSLAVIENQAQTLEIERWNRILTAPVPMFNTRPNAFLAEVTRDVRPGRALDVGMGQGRNAIYLAQLGWDVTGFDPAERAVAAGQDQARRLGLNLTALVMRDDQFEFGKEQWDLIVLSYVGFRALVPQLYESLRPGGLVVVEAFHRDATRTASIGGAVVFDTNELLRLFEHFRILRYEDTEGAGDFGHGNTRLVRLFARKP